MQVLQDVAFAQRRTTRDLPEVRVEAMTNPRQPIEKGSLTPEQVARMEADLADHYGEPVRPVSQYCNALWAWEKALIDTWKEREDGPLKDLGRALDEQAMSLWLAVTKSSMLGRLIYGGENLRTEKCPEHDGHWSGIGACRHGCDQTGWLPAKEEGC